MTDYAMKYSKKTLREYITYMITGNSPLKSLPLIICAAVVTAMPIASLVGYFMTRNVTMLIVTGAMLIFDIVLAVLMIILFRSYTTKLEAAFAAFDGLVCSVSSEKVILVRDGAPQSVFGWESITDIYNGKNAFFLKTSDDLPVILQKDNVLSGTAQETAEIIAEKQGR